MYMQNNTSQNIGQQSVWLLVLVFASISLGAWWYWSTSTNSSSSSVAVEQQSDQQNATARQERIAKMEEEVPFAELTIPHLQARTYQSQVSELEQISQNAEYISYLTSYESDGLQINGLLTQPSGEAPEDGWPAVVFIHGYIQPSQYRTTEKYEAYVDYLARNGFVVFKIDLRGHGDSDGEAGGAYYSSDYIIDVLHARAALQNFDAVNPEKIGLWGHSMAGNVVLRSLAVVPEIPAAVIWAGAVYTYDDWQQYGLSDNSYRPPTNNTQRQRTRSQLFTAHGEFDANSSFWQQVVPTNYLADLDGSIQLHHAVDDSVVSIEYSRDLEPLLEQAGIEHQLYEYQSGGHNIEGASFSLAMQRTVEFYKLWL